MTKSNVKPVVYDRFHLPPSPSLKFEDASLTRQEFVRESDINNIMAKYAAGLPSSPSGSRLPMFGDFSELPDYQSALDIVIKSQAAFEALPSAVRERFANDPAKLIDFLSDESNRDEAVRLGLVNPKPVNPKPVNPKPVEIVSVPSEKEGDGK